MKGYPLFVKLQGVRCQVYGGGKVATRKIQALLRRGAKVVCVSQDFSKSLRSLAKRNHRQLILKKNRGNRVALNGARLVITATSDRDFNARVAEACRKKGIWVNVVDDPELCDFYVPAVLERGPLQIAISTGGASPLFARRLREELERTIPFSTGRLLERLREIREKWIRRKR